jgi:ABC-2 type transport system permease protein
VSERSLSAPTWLGGLLAIAGRELRSAFETSMGWLVLTGWLGVAGTLWVSMLAHYVTVGRDQVFDPYAAQHLNPTDHLLGPWLANLGVVLLVVCPALAMRLYAEELRRHSMELLLTAPVSSAQIVLGKWLGALGVVGVLLGATLWMPVSLAWWTAPDWGALAAGYLGLALVASAVLGVGSVASAATDSPVVALVLTFAVALCLWVAGWINPDPTSLPSQLSLSAHLQDLVVGGVRASDVSYYALLTGWCLLATHSRVESWRYL